MAHHHEQNGRIYVDTAFLNGTNRIPGVTLKHMGFGEFYAETPKGRVDFDRMRGKDFPGQSGRSHEFRGKGADWLLDQMERAGISVRVASKDTDMNADRSALIRLAALLPVGSPERRAILAGCEKLPAGPMRDNCEKKKEEGASDKKAGTKTAGSGARNKAYLDSLNARQQLTILAAVAKTYGVGIEEIREELIHPDAEALYEYLAPNRSMAMKVLRDFQSGRYASSVREAGKGKVPDALKEHQFTGKDGDNPPPADADGDGKTNEPKPAGLKGKKAALVRLAAALPKGSDERKTLLAMAKAAAPIGSGENGYVARYKNKRVEVMADTQYEAQQIAAKHFRARKPYEVSVMLAEKGGKQVTHMPMFASKKTASRPLHVIAREIAADWGPKVHYAAKPYLRAMMSLDSINDSYGYDDADMIVRYFLTNARSWRGPVAKQIKAELKRML